MLHTYRQEDDDCDETPKPKTAPAMQEPKTAILKCSVKADRVLYGVYWPLQDLALVAYNLAVRLQKQQNTMVGSPRRGCNSSGGNSRRPHRSSRSS